MLTLRARLLLVLFFGAILPLGLVGYWLTRATVRSGEELLQVRLQETLDRMVTEVAARWTSQRSRIYDIAESPEVRALLRVPRPDSSNASALREVFERNRDDLTEISIRDAAGALHWSLADTTRSDATSGVAVPLSIDILAPASGERIGSLDVKLRFSALLTGAGDLRAAAGSILGAFDTRTGNSILPLSIEPNLVRQHRFSWGNEPWVSVRSTLADAPIEFVLAAPAAPFEQPFAAATRRGTLALFLVALASFGLVTLITARVTASLGRIADAADAVAAGDLEQNVPAEGGRELARVAGAFNRMTDHLRDTLTDLSQQKALAAVGEFAASLAHEVRNPLSSIRMDLQMAQEKAGDSPAANLVQRALGTVERLSATVTGALRIARSGRVQKQPLDVWRALEAAHHTARTEFQHRGARLEPLPAADAPIVVYGDVAALEQVFLNLLLNAADAAGANGCGGVTVCRDNTHVAVTVWDNGPGMSAAVRARAFDPFYSTKSDGTGLGLPIARRIVAAHAGELTIEDGANGGTAVTVRLSLASTGTTRSTAKSAVVGAAVH